MKLSDDIRKIAVSVKTTPEMDKTYLEKLASKGDAVSTYAIAKIVELEFSFEYRKEQIHEDVHDVLKSAYNKLDECKGTIEGIVDVMMEIEFVLENLT